MASVTDARHAAADASAASDVPPLTRRLRLCRIVTVPLTLTTLLRQQIRAIVEAGIDLTVVASPGPELDEIGRLGSMSCYALTMARKPSPVRDLGALWRLTRFFQRQQFDVVHSSTPKAGLLTALAGAVARAPLRLHTYTGQVWIELRGPTRWLARSSDRLIGWLSTHTFADSASQRDFLIAEGIVHPGKISVLGAGSISGVDLRRFDPAAKDRVRAEVRRKLGISDTANVIIFVGRATRDKGMVELVTAFRRLRESHYDVDLLTVGPLEPERDPLPAETLSQMSSDSHIHAIGFTAKPEDYLAAADIFCLPSYREGFGSVVIEAGAMGLPAVATRVTGLVDAVVEGETGHLVPPKDVPALVQALREMIESPDLRRRMGAAARQRAVDYFDAAVVNQVVVDEYFRLTTIAERPLHL